MQAGPTSGGRPDGLSRLRLRAALPLLAIIALAIAVRLVAFWEIRDGPLVRLHHWAESDMHFYNSWARRIVAGDLLTNTSLRPYHSWHHHIAREVHAASGAAGPFSDTVVEQIWNRWLGQKTFYEDPLYAYLLAGVYGVKGYDVRTVIVIQLFLGVACVALVYALALLLFDRPTATVAGGMAALYGPLIMYETVLLRCVVITFSGLATVCLAIGAVRRPGHGVWLFLTGLMCGVTFLLKSSSLLFSVSALALLAYWMRSDGVGVARNAGLMLIGFGLAVSPLVARNIAVGNAPLGLTASGAITFVNHNAEDYVAETGDHLSVHAAGIMQRADGALMPAVVETLQTHPSASSWLRLLGRKFLAFWHWYEVPNNASYYYFRLHARVASSVFLDFYWIAPLAVVGLFIAGWPSRAQVLAVLYIGCGVVTVVLFYHLARFRVPIVCAMLPFAGFASVSVARWLWSGRYLRAGVTLGAVLLLGLFVTRPLPPMLTSVYRPADFGVGNEIAAHYAGEAAAAGEVAAALRLLDRQLETQPPGLRSADPASAETRLSLLEASIAGGFVDLHDLAAALNRRLGHGERARYHAQRARVLRVIAAQFERAKAGD
jgi:4-amino-4-deoxy-L-arabinose transferase-like glycosyltransferase